MPRGGRSRVVAALGAVPVALAHGGAVPPPPSAGSFLFDWSFDPLVWLPAIARAARLAARRRHGRPRATRPTRRAPPHGSWTLACSRSLVALDSGIERYDTTLFSVHMVQHLLLTLVAPPLLLCAGPITLLLQASLARDPQALDPAGAPLAGPPALSFPVVAWLLFAGVMWASHFSPLFDLALENEWVHRLEHALFLGAALLFWWPVVGPDPSPWRMAPPVKVLYVGLQMPQNTFLALAIYLATVPLYAHYVTTIRPWGPTPLEDQQTAGGIMWLAATSCS